jgi:hypothetical protein
VWSRGRRYPTARLSGASTSRIAYSTRSLRVDYRLALLDSPHSYPASQTVRDSYVIVAWTALSIRGDSRRSSRQVVTVMPAALSRRTKSVRIVVAAVVRRRPREADSDPRQDLENEDFHRSSCLRTNHCQDLDFLAISACD